MFTIRMRLRISRYPAALYVYPWWNKVLPVSVELLMVLFAVEMADWLVTGVPTVVAVVVEELFGERAFAACAWTCACAWRL